MLLNCTLKIDTIIKAKGTSEEETLKKFLDHINKTILLNSKEIFLFDVRIMEEDISITKVRNMYEINLSWLSSLPLDTKDIPFGIEVSTNMLQGIEIPFKDLIKKSFKNSNFALCKFVKPYIASVNVK